MLPIDPGDGPGSVTPAQPLSNIVPPQAMAHGSTIIRPGAVAWGGLRDARDGGYSSCESVERSLAAAIDSPGRLPGLLAELATSRLWVPLPVRQRPFTDGSAVRLPLIDYDGAEFVPCFTSVQRLTAWAELAAPGEQVPAYRAFPAIGGGRSWQRAGDARVVPHLVLPAVGLARRLPGSLGLAVNPDSVPGLPMLPRVRALPGPAGRPGGRRGGRRPAARPPGHGAPGVGQRAPVPGRAPAGRAGRAAGGGPGHAADGARRAPGRPRLAVGPGRARARAWSSRSPWTTRPASPPGPRPLARSSRPPPRSRCGSRSRWTSPSRASPPRTPTAPASDRRRRARSTPSTPGSRPTPAPSTPARKPRRVPRPGAPLGKLSAWNVASEPSRAAGTCISLIVAR